MKYTDAITDFFRSPKWGTNLLLGAVCVLIPMIGPLVLSGWLIGLFWARGDQNDPARFPSFDFNNFVKYLERGLWPFLVSLAASLILVPIIMVGVIVIMLMAAAFDGHSEIGEIFMGLSLFVGLIAYLIIILGFHTIMIPLMLKATITQDFMKAFDLKFMKEFLGRVWKELLTTALFFLGVGFAMAVITVITCYIGGILAAPVVWFAWVHLQKQLYQLYLERGGEPIPLSDKLNDLPPALPQP